jgi:hypothetical protein
MGDRIRIFALFGLLGFIAGIIANLAARYFIPWLMNMIFPSLLVEWVLSGFAGAFLTIVLVTVWAYITSPPEA